MTWLDQQREIAEQNRAEAKAEEAWEDFDFAKIDRVTDDYERFLDRMWE